VIPLTFWEIISIIGGNTFASRGFQEGDATDLIDLVVTIFGAMFAPKPFELLKKWYVLPNPAEE